MEKVLFFGYSNEKKIPWSEGFEMKADGRIDFSTSGVNKLDIEDGKDIRWIDIFNSQINSLATPDEILDTKESDPGYPFNIEPFIVYEKYQDRLWNKLREYCGSKSELDFFNLYLDLCLNSFLDGGLSKPALIPQVYINWFFSPNERDKNKQQKPFRVDFVFKSSKFGTDNLVIVEIDGESYYTKQWDKNQNRYISAEEVFEMHLKRDRWLRKKGFKVFRIGNNEIKSIKSLPTQEEQFEVFSHFFKEIFGFYIHPEEVMLIRL